MAEIDYSEIEMVQEIMDELTEELEATDDQFNATLLSLKVIGAYREVRKARKYPSYYTEAEIESDMNQFYDVCRNVALYDYNTIGMEWQKINKENQVSREFVRRTSLLSGVLPLAHL